VLNLSIYLNVVNEKYNMKLTKDKQIETLTLSIQQLLQENTELKTQIELLKEDITFSYRDGYDTGYEDCCDEGSL